MQLGQVKLNDVEHQKGHKERLCFYCSNFQNQVAQCSARLSAKVPQSTPEQATSTMVSLIHFHSHTNSVLPVQIVHSGIVYSVTGNFMDCTLTEKLHLQLLQHPLRVQPLDGGPIRGELITHSTDPSYQCHAPRTHLSPSHSHKKASGGFVLPVDANSWPSNLLEGARDQVLVSTLPC